jgi:hypothetical protein
MTKELNELSKKILKSYVKKSTTSMNRAIARGDKEEDKAMSTDGNKYPEKQKRHNDNANKEFKTAAKRDSGIESANNRLIKKVLKKEEIEIDDVFEDENGVEFTVTSIDEENDLVVMESEEEIVELSKETLRTYADKAGPDATKNIMKAVNLRKPIAAKSINGHNMKKLRDKVAKDSERKAVNRMTGLNKANKKINEEGNEMKDYNVGDILENEEGESFTIVEISETEATLENSEGVKTVVETTAISSLKPNALPLADPKSKVETMKAVIGSLAAMSLDDLTHFAASIAKPENKAPDSSNKNKDSVKMKDSDAVGKGGALPAQAMPKIQKEDMDALFGETELTEEFKEKLSTIFETTMSIRLIEKSLELEEEFEAKLEESVAEIEDFMVEQLNDYLQIYSEKWIEENVVAIETSLKNEITESFIDGLKNLFVESYVDIPEDKLDVLEALTEKVEELETALNEQINENLELKRKDVETQQSDVIDTVAEGLTVNDKEKFISLIESVDFDGDFEKYERKLNIVKEKYFSNEVKNNSLNEEVFLSEENDKPNNLVVDPLMKNISAAISRTKSK